MRDIVSVMKNTYGTTRMCHLVLDIREGYPAATIVPGTDPSSWQITIENRGLFAEDWFTLLINQHDCVVLRSEVVDNVYTFIICHV